VEILRWAALPPTNQREVLRLVGELGGEWWGGGQAEFRKSWAAFEFIARLRGAGEYCRLVDEVGTPVLH
jgi:hypothetical protein